MSFWGASELMSLYSNMSSIQDTIREVPHALTNGKVIPVFGRILIFTQIWMKVWMVIIEMIPTPIIFDWGSLSFWRWERTYRNIRQYSPSKMRFPANPISSEKAAKMKSDWASGMYQNFWSPFPYPSPKNPPPPIALRACSFCRPICSSWLTWSFWLIPKKYENLLWM